MQKLFKSIFFWDFITSNNAILDTNIAGCALFVFVKSSSGPWKIIFDKGSFNILSASISAFKIKDVTLDEVKKHNKETDAWIVIDDNVYNITDYIDKHPGGKESILKYAGKDATKAFYQIHEKYMLDDLKAIGKIKLIIL